MQGFLQDLRFALRQFSERGAFSVAAVLVLGFGLGANTAIFSVVNILLLRPLPYRDANRIAALYERNIGGEKEIYNVAAPGTFADWQKLATTFDEIGGYVTGPMTVGAPDRGTAPYRVDAAAASRQIFTILGVAPLQGRIFNPEEDRPGAQRVAVIDYGLWQERFGGAPDIVGRRIHLDGVDCEVVGVMPPGFPVPQQTTQARQALGTFLPPGRQGT